MYKNKIEQNNNNNIFWIHFLLTLISLFNYFFFSKKVPIFECYLYLKGYFSDVY